MRLNKFLSRCGVVSRRGADELITAGKVKVNGELITQTGVVIDESSDVVEVRGKVCSIPDKYVYVALNKPRDYLVTLDDRFGRRTVKELIKDVSRRVYPVGRLDYDSEGLLILTDDGDLAFRLAHPSYQVKKIYTVGVKGTMPDSALSLFEKGIELEDGHLARARVRILKRNEKSTTLAIELTEGRKREIKRMCKIVGYPVRSLRRVQYDTISLSGLPRGRWRYLTGDEVANLKRRVKLQS